MDARNVTACAVCARETREARKNAWVQAAAGAILLAVGFFTARSGYGEAVGPAHPLCAALVLAGGLWLLSQAVTVVFKALLSQYGHFAMSAEEAAFSPYEFRMAAALVLAGLRLLILWRPLQVVAELALAAILLYCVPARLRGVRRDARSIALAALAALGGAAALGLVCGVFAGFSWTMSMGVAAAGFALDSLWCALGGRTAQ